ncbi:MAG: S8 family serine peptidase [Alphaproteobacteria bacterium]|nr:S8 family serine peptidase [Alphaproteobacteria bacterium]
MRWMNAFLSAILCTATVAGSADAFTINASRCDNAIYRKNNPDECKSRNSFSFVSGGVIAGGALAAVGAGLALMGGALGGGDNGATTSIPQPQMATMSAYMHVGGDVSDIQLANVMGDKNYARNFDQYNEIRVAYSLARGYTGKNSTIAILDTGFDVWHGQKVAQIASTTIAPDATINNYKIIDGDENFLAFNQIGDIINSATDANIYNASWVIKNRYATQIKSRNDLVHATDAHFIESMERAARERDAIFVWAAGNNGTNQSGAISALPLVSDDMVGHFVNVVAWDNETGALADFSNACGITKDYCITAPGTNLSAGYSSNINGTSFATPIVTAAIAVIREAFPYMKSTQITELLFATARDLGVVGVDETYGHGMLDLERATRPVGAELVPISENITRPLTTVQVSGTIAKQIKDENLELAFVDGFGRAFTTKLNDNIKVKNQGRGFIRLREETQNVAAFGNFEFGLRNSDFLGADGFLSTDDKTQITFIASRGEYNIGNVKLFQRTEFGIANPRISGESIITDISNVYTTSITLGAEFGDWKLSVATNDAILDGTMTMRIPTGRDANGTLIYANHNIDLVSRPAIEYNVGYKNITAGFVDNPYGTDEFYILTRGKITF